MTADAAKAKSIFLSAIEEHQPVQWPAFLDDACADDVALRAQVEKLLRAHADLGDFREKSAAGISAAIETPPIAERPGQTIGRYKLLQQIGEGGMGIVYRAEQRQPMRREVALKIIKPGMDTRQVVARFEAERQTLALMDHSNIAHVLDGGETDSGRPYFVMEFVHGVPLTDYCDQNSLTTRERLELFAKVCEAVQHAHQKGIIHRDLKPSNVMVTLYDGVPVPKIIDFGVAKATNLNLTEKTFYTGHGQILGTPLYMSPEQAGMSSLDVDTRSDIYSLGVLLYELLTGTTPFDKERFKEAGYDEMRRIIREEEPRKPSTQIRTLGQGATTLSTQRKSDPRRLSRLIRGELDWIVMKALEKDRNRRYDTADALARDIERYLHDEPVQACPPSAWYRFRKFARRNKAALAVAACLFFLVAFTSIGSSVVAIATRHQLDLTLKANEERTRQLFQSLVAQARGKRLSRRLGQRFESLGALEEATRLAHRLNLPEEDFRELRNEVIACLTLPDLRVAKEWPSPPCISFAVVFDEKLEHYAWEDNKGNISIRQVAGDTEICRFQTGFGAALLGFSFDGRFLAAAVLAADADGWARLWRVGGPEPELIREEPRSLSVAFSPDNRLFAVGHADGSIGLFDLPSGKPLRQLAAGARPRIMAFKPNGGQLAVASSTSVQVRDVKTGKTSAEFQYPPEVWPFVAWQADGKTVAMFGGDRVIYLGDVATGKQTVKLEGFKSGGIGVTFNHAGDLLASTDWGDTLRLWDPHTGQELFRTAGSWRERRFSPDDRLLAADQKDNKLRLWEVVASRVYRTLVRDTVLGKGVYRTCAVSPKGTLLAAGMDDGFGFWDCRTGVALGFVRLNTAYHVIFESADALLTDGAAGPFRWPVQPDPASPGLVRIGPPARLPLPANEVTTIACSLDGRVLASAQSWGALVWHRDRPGKLIRLTPHEDPRYISVGPDGRYVATGSHWHGGAKVWDAATGRLVKDLVPTQPFVQVGFSPDGKWLVTGGAVCRLWAVDSWHEGPSLGEGDRFAFSPDGRLLAVEMGQGAVRLVDPDTGREYARLEDPNQDRAGYIAFSPDGAQLIVCEADSLHVWDLRIIRKELARRGLDWDLPPYPPAGDPQDAPPLRVTVDLGDMDKTTHHENKKVETTQ